MPNQERARAIRAHNRAVLRTAKKAAMAQPVLNTQMSRAEIAIYYMRRKGTLNQLTGDGELNEQDLEDEWQHKLEMLPDWQKKMDGMTDHKKKKNFLRHRHDAFIEGIRKAFARARAKLDAGKLAPVDTDGEKSASSEPVEEGDEVEDALTETPEDHLQELDGFQKELPQEVPRTLPQQGLSQKEYEALALAMFQRNRIHQDDPNQELSKGEYEAQALAKITEERKQQSERSEEDLLFKESQRIKEKRKNEAKKKAAKKEATTENATIKKATRKKTTRASELKALEARRKKFDAQRKLYKEAQRLKKVTRKSKLKAFDAARKKFTAKKTKIQVRKAGREAAKEQRARALEVEKQAEANGPLQEELAQIRREAKKNRKKRKRAAFLEADPHPRGERAQIDFGFRYFPKKKARTGTRKQALKNEVSWATRR